MLEPLKMPLALAGRTLLALMFILAGYSKLTHLDATAAYMASGGLPLPSLLAPLVGGFELLAGLALAVGFMTRWVALALGLFTLMASVLFHNFWAMPVDQQTIQQLLFMKNLAVAGGMFMVTALGAGPISVDARRDS